jgi:hypothetical protein
VRRARLPGGTRCYVARKGDLGGTSPRNTGSAGGNDGGHLKEGTFRFDPTTGDVSLGPDPVPGLIDPVAAYDHFEATAGKITRIAIVGDFVSRGSNAPALRGTYTGADLNGFLFDVALGTGKIEQLLDAGMFIKGLGQDSEGELYVLGSKIEGPSGAAGVVMRITAGP